MWYLLEGAVILLPTIFAVVIELVSKEIKGRPFWRIGVFAFGISVSFLTLLQIHRAGKVAREEREIAVQETSDRVTKTVTDAMGKQFGNLITDLTSQNNALSEQLGAQSKQLALIGESNIVSGKAPVKVEVTNPSSGVGEVPDIHVARTPATPNPAYGKNATQFIFTTNKAMNGGRVRIRCKQKINRGSATLAGAGAMLFGGGGVVDEHTYQSGIGAPNWSPDFPLIITLYFDDDDLGACQATPLS